MNYETIQTEHGTFFHRPGTSDLKAIDEVCNKSGYERRGFSIEPGERWLDLGANVGAFTVYAGLKGASVLALEPDPENYVVLVKNVAWNSIPALMQRAAGWSSDGAMTFHRNSARGNLWRNSLLKEWKGGEDITVPTVDIRPLVLPGTCLKIDVEGAEYEILKCLINANLMQNVPKFALEWSFDILPEIAKFKETMAALAISHTLLGVSDNYMQRLEGHEVWPPAWFPPCAKVYGIRK